MLARQLLTLQGMSGSGLMYATVPTALGLATRLYSSLDVACRSHAAKPGDIAMSLVRNSQAARTSACERKPIDLHTC